MSAKSDKQSGTTKCQKDDITEKIIGGKRYIVMSVYVGEQDVKTTLLKLAERRAIREMGLDYAVT